MSILLIVVPMKTFQYLNGNRLLKMKWKRLIIAKCLDFICFTVASASAKVIANIPPFEP